MMNKKQQQDWKNQSISLVCTDPSTNKFMLTEEGQKFLNSLEQPIAIVSIAGLYRTGKSFLVNKIIPSSNSNFCSRNSKKNDGNGFKVGTTTQSMTKGLNIWGTPITIQCEETGEDINYLVIDSEGMGSCEQQSQYDTNLMILIFLLSSTVVYNSVGAIDQTGLEQLQVVLKLRKCVEEGQSYCMDDSDRYSSDDQMIQKSDRAEDKKVGKHKYRIKSDYSPKFIWALRDFALQLIDKNGEQITPDQYLEQCLEEIPLVFNNTNQSTITNLRKKNAIRKAIKEHLPDRSCFTLVRPTIREQDLHKLSHQTNSVQLRGEFLQEIENLKDQIFSGNIKDIKSFNGERISGRLYSKILKQYIALINDDKMPNVKDIWDCVVNQKCQEVFEEFIEILKRQIKQKIKLPIFEEDALKMKINDIENRVFSEMLKKMGLQTNEKTKKKDSAIDKKRQYFKKQFIKEAQKINKQLKIKNSEQINDRTMDELRKFVKNNINFQEISALNELSVAKDGKQQFSISQFLKNFLERAKGKIKTQQNELSTSHQAYQYLLTVVTDIVYILEKKWNKISSQNQQARTVIQEINKQKNIKDIQMINLKKDYHQALKDIGKYQEERSTYDKKEINLQGKIMEYQRKISKLQAEFSDEKEKYERKIKVNLDKNSSKWEETFKEMKKYRQKSENLQKLYEQAKQQLKKKQITGRKQIIFQEKIKQTYERFDQEKVEKQKQIAQLKGNLLKKQMQYGQIEQLYKMEVKKRQKLEQNFKKKQQNLLKQFQSLKQCMKNTKQSYELTYKTMRNGDQVCKDLTNLATSQKKSCRKSLTKDNKRSRIPTQQEGEESIQVHDDDSKQSKLLRNYYQNQLQKQKYEYESCERKFQEKITTLTDSIEREKLNKQNYYMQSKEYKEKCMKLQMEVTEANKKFGQHLKEIQEARQRQRSLYEESIVRLLQNIERKQSSGGSVMGMTGRRMR